MNKILKTENELTFLRSQFATSSEHGGRRYLPYAFTEHGILQAANVLNSQKAVLTGIRLIEVFIKMRELLSLNKNMLHKLNILEKNDIEHNKKFQFLFNYLKKFEEAKQKEQDFKNRKPIGFRK